MASGEDTQRALGDRWPPPPSPPAENLWAEPPSPAVGRALVRQRWIRTLTLPVALLVVVSLVATVLVAFPPAARRTVIIDGSSTVYPITSAWAEILNSRGPSVQYVVGFSGTGAGFEKFCDGRSQLSDASRPIKAGEVAACRERGIEPLNFTVAFDGLSVVVPKSNDFVDYLTVPELCRIWTSSADADACGGAGPRVTRWSQLRAAWPDAAIELFGPGTDSGTFDYWTEAILEPFDEAITDAYFPSEDDNVLVEGVASSPHSLGYFGYAYAVENEARLRLLPVDDGDPGNGDGPIPPNSATIENGTYAPLSRPLFVYADANGTLQDPAIHDFLAFGLSDEGQDLAGLVGYVRLDAATLDAQRSKLG